MKTTERFTLAVLLCVIFVEANAADMQLAALSEEDFLADIPVVLTATRMAQPINEAPAAMTIIDRQMIEASGAREIAELFKLVPGFQVNHENGHTPIVTYNGLSDQFSRRMQVLIDGRSIYTPILGGVDWAQLPLSMDDIERIEVTRGPNAASYGANAFLAIINIITRHASETTGYFARYTTGSDNIKDGVLRYGNTTGDLDYRVTLGYVSDSGFAEPYDDAKIRNALFRADYVTGAKDTFNVQAGYANTSRGVYSDGGDPPFPTLDKKGIDRFQQFRWAHEIDRTQDLQIQYYHNDHVIYENWVIVNDPDWVDFMGGVGITGQDIVTKLDISHHSQRHDIEIQHTYVPNKFWRVAWGGSLRRELFSAPELTRDDSRSHADLKRLFANGEWRADEHWLVNAGAMWEDNDFTPPSLSPRAAVHFKADHHHTLRLVASKATRTPTLIEEEDEVILHLSGPAMDTFQTIFPGFPRDLPLFMSEENVDAEKISSVEIGLNATYPSLGMNLDIKLFKNHVENLINLVPRTVPLINWEYSIQDNVDNATVRGIETYLDVKTADRIRAIFSYAYTRIESDDTYEQYSETMPLHNVSILLSKEFESNINTSLAFYRVTLAEGLGTGNPISPHNRADFRIAFPFRSNGVRGDVAFVTQGFLGGYTDWRNENNFKPRHFVSMTAQF